MYSSFFLDERHNYKRTSFDWAAEHRIQTYCRHGKTSPWLCFCCSISLLWNKIYDLDNLQHCPIKLHQLHGTSKGHDLGLGAKKCQQDDRKDGGGEQNMDCKSFLIWAETPWMKLKTLWKKTKHMKGRLQRSTWFSALSCWSMFFFFFFNVFSCHRKGGPAVLRWNLYETQTSRYRLKGNHMVKLAHRFGHVSGCRNVCPRSPKDIFFAPFTVFFFPNLDKKCKTFLFPQD